MISPAAASAKSADHMSTFNYFNYFTEIEEYFWKKRGAHILVSPLDWAILETWQNAGIPISAVVKGIDRAFESYARSRRGQSGRLLKSLAYCVEAVLDAAEEEKEAAAGTGPEAISTRPVAEPFSREELKRYFNRNSESLARAADKLTLQSDLSGRIRDTASKLVELLPIIDSPSRIDLQDLERRLTVLEEKLTASLMSYSGEELLLNIQRDLDRQLAPYRRKMTSDQLTSLERRYTKKRLFEAHGLPRLSLFYLS
jgi:hypothetical protein